MTKQFVYIGTIIDVSVLSDTHAFHPGCSIMIHTYISIMVLLCIFTVLGAFASGTLKQNSLKVFTVSTIAIPLFIAVLSFLLLNINGRPIIEWLLPLLCIVISKIVYRSTRAFVCIALTCVAASVLLPILFIQLFSEGYTTNVANFEQRNQILAAVAALKKEYGENAILEPQYIDQLLESPVNPAEKVTLHKEWHTIFTRLYRIERSEGRLWYPGGKVSECRNSILVK